MNAGMAWWVTYLTKAEEGLTTDALKKSLDDPDRTGEEVARELMSAILRAIKRQDFTPHLHGVTEGIMAGFAVLLMMTPPEERETRVRRFVERSMQSTRMMMDTLRECVEEQA